jgi:hypothetical protein
MMSIRKWERFQFMVEYEAQQVFPPLFFSSMCEKIAENFGVS